MAESQEKQKVFYPGKSYWVEEKDGLHLIGTHCKCDLRDFFKLSRGTEEELKSVFN
jgi:hypothetical protein